MAITLIGVIRVKSDSRTIAFHIWVMLAYAVAVVICVQRRSDYRYDKGHVRHLRTVTGWRFTIHLHSLRLWLTERSIEWDHNTICDRCIDHVYYLFKKVSAAKDCGRNIIEHIISSIWKLLTGWSNQEENPSSIENRHDKMSHSPAKNFTH